MYYWAAYGQSHLFTVSWSLDEMAVVAIAWLSLACHTPKRMMLWSIRLRACANCSNLCAWPTTARLARIVPWPQKRPVLCTLHYYCMAGLVSECQTVGLIEYEIVVTCNVTVHLMPLVKVRAPHDDYHLSSIHCIDANNFMCTLRCEPTLEL